MPFNPGLVLWEIIGVRICCGLSLLLLLGASIWWWLRRRRKGGEDDRPV